MIRIIYLFLFPILAVFAHDSFTVSVSLGGRDGKIVTYTLPAGLPEIQHRDVGTITLSTPSQSSKASTTAALSTPNTHSTSKTGSNKSITSSTPSTPSTPTAPSTPSGSSRSSSSLNTHSSDKSSTRSTPTTPSTPTASSLSNSSSTRRSSNSSASSVRTTTPSTPTTPSITTGSSFSSSSSTKSSSKSNTSSTGSSSSKSNIVLTPTTPSTSTGSSTSGSSSTQNSSKSGSSSKSSGSASNTGSTASGGSSTRSGSSTAAGITGTTTVTSVSGLSTSTISNSKWSKNTVITTTTSGSSEPTVIPVLVGCSACGCSSCGIELFGLGSTGGTIFKLPGLPTFTINSDGTPDDNGDDHDDNSSTKTSSDDNSKTSTKKSSTTTSRSSTSSTSSSSSSSSSSSACTTACSSCWTYSADSDSYAGDDDPSSKLKARSIAGRIDLNKKSSNNHPTEGLHYLQRRADPFNSLGSCSLGFTVNIPGYPGPQKLTGYGSGGALWWFIQDQPAATSTNTCPALSFKQVSDSSITSETLNVGGTVKNYVRGGTVAPLVNVDHVYELSILKNFFARQVASLNCNDFINFFSVRPQGASKARLQTIWDQLPSNTNPDFAGMDASINRMKGYMFNDNLSGWSDKGIRTASTAVGRLSELAVAMAMTNDKDISALFKKTNTRIYQALLGVDAAINSLSAAAACPPATASVSTASVAAAPSISATWASAYSVYMTSLLSKQGASVSAKASSILATNLPAGSQSDPVTDTNGVRTSTKNSIGSAVDALTRKYDPVTAFEFSTASLLTWDTGATLSIRDVASAPACARSTASASQASSTGTASSSNPSASAGVSSAKASTAASRSSSQAQSTTSHAQISTSAELTSVEPSTTTPTSTSSETTSSSTTSTTDPYASEKAVCYSKCSGIESDPENPDWSWCELNCGGEFSRRRN